MGVPITFLNKHNPNQFKILGITSGRNEFENPTKRYINAIQINPNGTKVSGSKRQSTRANYVHLRNQVVYIILLIMQMDICQYCMLEF